MEVNLRNSTKELSRLSEGGQRAALMRAVDIVLADFTAANRDHNPYFNEKIHDVRTWFDELGKGSRGKWTFQHAQSNLRTSIAKLENVLSADGMFAEIKGPPGPR